MQSAKLVLMKRPLAFAFTVAGAVATTALAIDLGACGGQEGLSCRLGGQCSTTQVCAEGIAGCVSDCQCASGTWQAPCPAELPASGSACTGEGATCGYLTQAAECGGSVDCYCRSGEWTCSPTCITPPDAGPDAAAECIAAGGECLFSNVTCAVPGPQSCGPNLPGSYCCLSNVADCGQPSATTYACPVDPSEGGATCGSAPVPLGAPDYPALAQGADDDASYPVGCRVTFPACNNGHVPYCTCILGDSVPSWNCF
jgi:hypothetical protein